MIVLLQLLLVLSSLHPPARGNIRAQVRRVKTDLQRHESLRDYHQCPYQPDQLFDRIQALQKADAWDELCAELTQLPDEELELFEDALRAPRHAASLKCASALLGRIATYWKAAAKELQDTRGASGVVQPPGAAVPLPSVVSPIEVDKDGVLSDGYLPEGQVAITFDDGPHPTRTPRILAILQAAHVKATFFQMGRNAAAFPQVARQVMAAGHTVGSHTFSHPDLPRVPFEHAKVEIESGRAAVALALGMAPGDLRFFRFPYGAKTPGEQGFVRQEGFTTFFWNMDSQDWKIRNPHQLFLNVLAQLDRQRRGIILFHDIQEQTVIVLPHVLNELRARGIKTVVFAPARNEASIPTR